MAQLTTSGWAGNVAATSRKLGYGVLMDWTLATASGVQFFTIGTSLIGGSDIIKSGGGVPAFFDKYQFTDYSNYALSWNVDRRLGQYPYGLFMAQADIALDNSSKLFLPFFDPTIGSGILPNRPVKLSVGFNGELLNQFIGFTGKPQNTIGAGRQTILHAYDAVNYLNSYTSTASGVLTVSGLYTNQSASTIVGDLLGEAGFSSSQYVLDISLQSNIGYLSPGGSQIGDIIQALCEAEQALFFADENGILRFWNRQHFTTVSGSYATQSGIQTTVSGTYTTFTFANLSELNYANTPIFNDVTVQAIPRAVQPIQKVWGLTSYQTIQPGQSLTIEADFSDANGPLPVTYVQTPVSSSGGGTGISVYTVNTASDGSGSDATSSVTLVSTSSGGGIGGAANPADNYLGTTYYVTFHNTSGAAVYVTAMTLFGTPATVTQVISQRYQDGTSIANYGTNPGNMYQTIVIENDLIQDPSTAYALAYVLVKNYKDPLRRYENVPVFANPALQIGDFIALVNADTGETNTAYVTGIRTSLGTNGQLQQYLDFELRSFVHFFTIGSSSIGGTDSIAP